VARPEADLSRPATRSGLPARRQPHEANLLAPRVGGEPRSLPIVRAQRVGAEEAPHENGAEEAPDQNGTRAMTSTDRPNGARA
jgi:hypothetical protein